MAVTDGIWSPDDDTEFDPPADLAAMAASIAARIVATMTPAGSIVAHAGAAAPSGWLLAQGQAVSRTTYADLFAAIGTTFGAGDGSTTFNVPNLKGRVIAGVDAGQTEFTPRAKTGGAKTHTLTTAEMPSHNHGRRDIHTGGSPKNPGTYISSSGSNVFYTDGGSGYTADSAGTTSTGGGSAHNNLQPYMALNYIIKT